MTLTTTPTEIIGHTITWLDAINEEHPHSLSGAIDWINDARHAVENAADLIETLAIETHTLRSQLGNATQILDHLYPYLSRHLTHIPECDIDEHRYPDVVWLAGGCQACEAIALIRHLLDERTPQLTEREIDNTLSPIRFL